MTLEQFKIDFPARIAAMTKEERKALLEKAGCVFVDPWLETLLESSQIVPVATCASAGYGAAPDDLGLAA